MEEINLGPLKAKIARLGRDIIIVTPRDATVEMLTLLSRTLGDVGVERYLIIADNIEVVSEAEMNAKGWYRKKPED